MNMNNQGNKNNYQNDRMLDVDQKMKPKLDWKAGKL